MGLNYLKTERKFQEAMKKGLNINLISGVNLLKKARKVFTWVKMVVENISMQERILK